MRRKWYLLGMVAALVVWVVPLTAAGSGTGWTPTFFAQADPAPEAQPPTTPERLEGELPEEAVLHEGNRLVVGVFIFLLVVAVILALVWAFRSGRRNPPVTGRNDDRE